MPQGCTGIHQCRSIRHELKFTHHIEERLLQFLAVTSWIKTLFHRSDRVSYPPKELHWSLGNFPVLILKQIAALQYLDGVDTEFKDKVWRVVVDSRASEDPDPMLYLSKEVEECDSPAVISSYIEWLSAETEDGRHIYHTQIRLEYYQAHHHAHQQSEGHQPVSHVADLIALGR